MLTVANDSRNRQIEKIKKCHQAKSVGRFEMEPLLKNLKEGGVRVCGDAVLR